MCKLIPLLRKVCFGDQEEWADHKLCTLYVLVMPLVMFLALLSGHDLSAGEVTHHLEACIYPCLALPCLAHRLAWWPGTPPPTQSKHKPQLVYASIWCCMDVPVVDWLGGFMGRWMQQLVTEAGTAKGAHTLMPPGRA